MHPSPSNKIVCIIDGGVSSELSYWGGFLGRLKKKNVKKYSHEGFAPTLPTVIVVMSSVQTRDNNHTIIGIRIFI